MIALLIAALVCFVGQTTFVLAGIVTRQKMINLVNPRLPVTQRFKSTGRHPGNPPMRLSTVYQELYPDGPLVRQYRWRTALSFIAFFSWIGCLSLYGYLSRRH